jgi:hypothetical protein
MTCGALSCSSADCGSSGNIYFGDGLNTAPGLALSSDHKTGIFRFGGGTLGFTSNGNTYQTIGTSNVQFYEPVTTNGFSLSAGAITSSGTISCGTQSMTCGALSCTSINSTGDVVYPFYTLSVDRNSGQSIPSGSGTLVSFNQTQTNNNWGTVTLPQATFTIPVNGFYDVQYAVIWDSNAVGERLCAIYYNSGTRSFGTSQITANATDKTGQSGSASWQMVAGDVIQLLVFQSSGGNLNIGAAAATYMTIDRRHA